MKEVIDCIFKLFDLSFTINGIELTIGSVVIGTLLIYLVCFALGKLFD